MTGTLSNTEVEERARARAKALTDVIWHIGTFVIVNGFLWTLDLITDGHITWAYWTTIPWGLGLLFHVLAWYIQGRQIEERAAERYARQMTDDQRSEPQGAAGPDR